jgi:hypothetical protein
MSVPKEDCSEVTIETADLGPLLNACRWPLSCRISASCPLGTRPIFSRETIVLLKHLLEAGNARTAIAPAFGISRRLVNY